MADGHKKEIKAEGVLVMSEKIRIESNMKHKISEVICVKCGYRWIAARPKGTKLKELECEHCGAGFTIETGEEF